MDQISELTTILGQELNWNKARLDCFSRMLLSLLMVRTINLKKMSVAFCSSAQKASRYQRMKRFFSKFEIDRILIARMLFNWFSFTGKSLYITIDRTNWFFGKSKLNVFMLGIAYEGIAIPIVWHMLPKAGNASAKEHIALVNDFINIFGRKEIMGVLGDREFASQAFFKWLNKEKVPFYIRIKDNSQIYINSKKWRTAKKMFKGLNSKAQTSFQMDIQLWGQKLFLAGARSERGELMVVATNRPAKNAIPIYLRRWEIECLFQSLKGRGFKFEETHITQLERLEKLITLLSIAFCWAHKIGEWRAKKKPIGFNQYRESRRPQYTYFRYGLDWIQELLFSPKPNTREWKQCFLQLITSDLPPMEVKV